ncbi:MAG TPA: hypothetical protein VMY37_40845 [Thermoguttaceae bacterium]|nr:hypothetical protein [Thermoguttaceae bacterium]
MQSPESRQNATPPSGLGGARDGGIDRRRLLIDAAVGAGLLLAVALVFAFDRASSTSGGDQSGGVDTFEIVVDDGGGASAPPRRPLRLAVTPPEYDDVGKLLDTLGRGYRYTQIELDDLLHAERLAEYDVVFLTCGGVPRAWLERRLRDSERGSAGIYRPRPEVADAVHESFRKFVGHGGTLYASDLQFDLVSLAFPELVDKGRMGRGEVQTIEAEVVDPGLRRLLGAAIDLRFDMPAWRPAALRGPDVTTYLSGTYRLRDGAEQTGPLLVTFAHGEGTVVFTSFHNEAQNTELELELLRYLVFTTVTAREQGRIKQTMVRGGFSPTERNLLSASSASKSVKMTHLCQHRSSLQFVLGFEDQGAELRLRVVGPGGEEVEKQGAKTLTIEIDNARPGTWQYSITPIKIPYDNFPYTLTVGGKRPT